MGSMRQTNVLRLEPTMSQSRIPTPSMVPLGGMLPESQPANETWPQLSQTGVQQGPQPYSGMQAQPQPSFTSPNRPVQTPMRFRSAFAKQQVARSQSPLGRLSQRSFPRPHNAVSFSPSQEDNPSQHMSLSQQPSLALHPAPSANTAAPYSQQLQQPLPLSQLEPSQHQRPLLFQDFTMYQSSQIERPVSATHQATTPCAAQTGSQSASAAATKLLDQIGQVSSLQRQMTQLTAEVKETMKACEGMAGIAADVKALTASFQNLKEQLQLIRTDCAEEASKGHELASKLQETCNQLVAGLQKLSAHAPANRQGLTQPTQPVSRAVSAAPDKELQCPSADAPASRQGLTHHPQPVSRAVSAVPGQEVQRPSPHESAGDVPSDCEAAPKPAKRQGIKSRLTEYRRSRAKAAAPVKQPAATFKKLSDPSAAIQGIYQPSGGPQQAVAKPSCGHSSIGVRCQGKDSDGAAERVVQETARKAVSSRGKGFSHDVPSSAPSLKLSLQPLKASSMQPRTNTMAAAGPELPLSASSTANVHAPGEDLEKGRLPAKRRKSQQQYTGLDAFTKLFAQADMGPFEQSSMLPVIQEDKIAKEVTERLKMQRMRRMRA